MSQQPIKMYSTTWCGDCHRAKRVFDDLDAPYENINIESEPGALMDMMHLNGGLQSVPTILFPDGSVLIEPSTSELVQHLQERAA
ncbi:MAG: NrdH-redoxin [Chloroflexia bacterium]|nr:NrdH-redoxin [Chloroflexia bacterium]